MRKAKTKMNEKEKQKKEEEVHMFKEDRPGRVKEIYKESDR
jgi:hypothetical protein